MVKCGIFGVVFGALAFAGSVSADEPAEQAASAFQLESIRGRVVFLADAMQRRHGTRSVSEAQDRVLALETAEGQLIPLLEDVRGRAFRRDERLRNMDVELLVRRYETSPFVQVIRVAEVAKDAKYELDYWCDICAIVMFEKKDCECCQGETELRRRKVN